MTLFRWLYFDCDLTFIVIVMILPVTSIGNAGAFRLGIGGVFGGQISGIPQRSNSALVGHINKTGHVQQAGHDGMGGIGATSEITCLVLKLYGRN